LLAHTEAADKEEAKDAKLEDKTEYDSGDSDFCIMNEPDGIGQGFNTQVAVVAHSNLLSVKCAQLRPC
jgi:hypothetical protein